MKNTNKDNYEMVIYALKQDELRKRKETATQREKRKENEVWKDVEGTNGMYRVSNLGRVKSQWSGVWKTLKGHKQTAGYYQVFIYFPDGTVRPRLVHDIVMTTFKGTKPKGFTVNHLNENKTDNRLSNLEYISKADNIRYTLNKPVYMVDVFSNDIVIFPSLKCFASTQQIHEMTARSYIKKRRLYCGKFIITHDKPNVEKGIRY